MKKTNTKRATWVSRNPWPKICYVSARSSCASAKTSEGRVKNIREKKFKWVHVYGITTIIICVANDVAQLSDACTLYACWADAINMENMDLALSTTSLMSPACVASNSLNNRTCGNLACRRFLLATLPNAIIY